MKVSLLSLGSGGPNRFGSDRYTPASEITRLVRRALELGINLFDTAGTYGDSESLLGAALRGVPRERYVLATKVLPWDADGLLSGAGLARQVTGSLRRLSVDHLDLLQLHRVPRESYAQIMQQLRPELERLRGSGKVRFFGITESSSRDPGHETLLRALDDDFFDALMVAYHLGNPSAAATVLPRARDNDIGVIGMVAARHLVPRSIARRLFLFGRALTAVARSPSPARHWRARLSRVFATLEPGLARSPISLERERGGDRLVLPEAAYTFVGAHPDVGTVLTGSTNIRHLERNLEAVLAAPLTASEVERLQAWLDIASPKNGSDVTQAPR